MEPARGPGQPCSRAGLGLRNLRGSDLEGQAWSHHILSAGVDTDLGTRRRLLCSRRTGQLRSWLALCHTHRYLQSGQGGNFNPCSTSRGPRPEVTGCQPRTTVSGLPCSGLGPWTGPARLRFGLDHI